MFANQPPQLVCIRTLKGPGLPFPSTPPRGGGGMNLKNSRQPSALSLQPKLNPLPLTELEALSCALLSVLLTLFGARVASHHAFALELRAEFSIELHES